MWNDYVKEKNLKLKRNSISSDTISHVNKKLKK